MTKELRHPEELRYTPRHIWCRQDGDTMLAGVTDFAQSQLGEVLFVDLPTPGTHFVADAVFGTVESLKTVSSLYMPVAGEVLEANAALEDEPTMVNRDCYGQGWMIRIQPDSLAELADAATYLASLN